jgi:hypothetical protein
MASDTISQEAAFYVVPQSKLKYEKNQGDFFRSKKSPDTRKGDRHRLDRKTRYWIDFLKSEKYQLTSAEKIISQSVLSGGRESPYIALAINNKNLFFLKNYPTEPYYLERQKDFLFSHLVWREQEELNNLLKKEPRQFRKKWQEIKLKTEILSKWDNPAKLVPGYKENGRPRPTWEGVGWNSPDYREPKNRSLAALAFKHEIVLGKVDVPLLDLDPNKKDKEGNYKIKQEWLRKALSIGGKKWQVLINKYRIPYYWTTGTPGNSCLPFPFWLIGFLRGMKIYHQDTGQEVADLLACGDLVALPVGGDKNRQLVITKWGKKLVKKHGISGIFNKKLLSGDIKEEIEKFLGTIFLTLDKPAVVGKKKPRRYETRDLSFSQERFSKPEQLKPPRENLPRAKILSKYKTPLPDIWKIFYRDQQRRTGCFLLNDYHRNVLDDLKVGNERNIFLVSGRKHKFLSRIIQ